MSQELKCSREKFLLHLNEIDADKHVQTASDHGWALYDLKCTQLLTGKSPCGYEVKKHAIHAKSLIFDEIRVFACPKCTGKGSFSYKLHEHVPDKKEEVPAKLVDKKISKREV